MDLSNMSNDEALKVFLENAVIYTDANGNTKKLNGSWGEVVDFWGDEFKKLAENVGRENMFIYSMNDSDNILEGNRWANIFCRFVTTTYFKLPEWGLEFWENTLRS